MSELNLHDLLLSDGIKEKCPGLSEPIYEFAKYIGEHISTGELLPEAFALTAALSLCDVQQGRCSFNIGSSKFPQYLIDHQTEVLLQAHLVLQIIDAVTDEEFAAEARKICKETMKWDPPKKPVAENICVKTPDGCPANIVAAVDWWRKTLASPKMDNGDSQMGLFMLLLGSGLTSRNTENAIASFCDELSRLLCTEAENGITEFSLDVDYGPGGLLYEASEIAGVNLQFPCKTHMRVNPDKVVVSYGYCAPYETIWQVA